MTHRPTDTDSQPHNHTTPGSYAHMWWSVWWIMGWETPLLQSCLASCRPWRWSRTVSSVHWALHWGRSAARACCHSRCMSARSHSARTLQKKGGKKKVTKKKSSTQFKFAWIENNRYLQIPGCIFNMHTIERKGTRQKPNCWWKVQMICVEVKKSINSNSKLTKCLHMKPRTHFQSQ